MLNHSEIRKFYILYFLQFLVDILPPGSGSVDLHIFADPDPGSQNLALDQTKENFVKTNQMTALAQTHSSNVDNQKSATRSYLTIFFGTFSILLFSF